MVFYLRSGKCPSSVKKFHSIAFSAWDLLVCILTVLNSTILFKVCLYLKHVILSCLDVKATLTASCVFTDNAFNLLHFNTLR